MTICVCAGVFCARVCVCACFQDDYLPSEGTYTYGKDDAALLAPITSLSCRVTQ